LVHLLKDTDHMMLTFRRRSGERGFITVAYAAMLTAIMGFTGLAVDVGYLQYQKRRIQSAADAAAMGALREMERGKTDTSFAGQNDASLNGFTDGVSNTTVTVATPTSGLYANDTTAIQATVTRTVPTFFMQVFGQRSVSISAIAVAKTTTTFGSIGGCIFVMDPSASGALTVHGTMNLETACSIVVNSNSSSAFSAVGNSNLLMDNNAVVGVVGPGTAGQGWSMTGGATVQNHASGASMSPVNVQSFTDPLAAAKVPTATGVTVQVAATNNPKTIQKNSQPAGGLNPGVYCGGLKIQSTNTPLTLNSGTYIIAGGGLEIDAQADVQTAAGGVMFYNTSSNSDTWGCTGSAVAAGGITINGGSVLTLNALTSTDMSFTGASNAIGMLIFEDRNVTGLSHKINGSAGNTFDGAIYVPKAALNFIGTSSTGGYLVIVTNTLDIGGTSQLKNDFTTLTTVNTLAPAATGGGLVQ
jgi:Flp pilus assembly protein TadG